MAQYRDGTVTVTSNSATITGTDTKWVTAGIEPGHWFTVRGQGITYTVAAVISDTQLILSGAYQGTTEAGVYYLLHTDFTPRGYAVPGPGDVDATIIVRRAIYDIDADMTAALGAPDGAAKPFYIEDIVNLKSSTALTGQVMTKLADGTYGFITPSALSITIANIGSTGNNAGHIYAGTNGTTGAHQFRALEVIGASLAQNPDRLTLTVPASGEVNTLASAGSQTSVSLVAAKSGSTLNLAGIRSGTGISLVRDGNDVVVTNTITSGGGGTTTGGEANTAENLGSGTTNVVRSFSDKLGVSLRFRSMLFNVDHFTVSGETSGQYSISLKRQRLSDSPDVDVVSAVAGSIIRLESDGVWRAQPLPPAGIASVQADTAPKLGGDLATAGKRIVGIDSTISGMIERPKAKYYTLILRNNAAFTMHSMTGTCSAGSVTFEVFLGATIADVEAGGGAPIIATASASAPGEALIPDAILVHVGARLTMRLVTPSADIADFAFSIATKSA